MSKKEKDLAPNLSPLPAQYLPKELDIVSSNKRPEELIAGALTKEDVDILAIKNVVAKPKESNKIFKRYVA